MPITGVLERRMVSFSLRIMREGEKRKVLVTLMIKGKAQSQKWPVPLPDEDLLPLGLGFGNWLEGEIRKAFPSPGGISFSVPNPQIKMGQTDPDWSLAANLAEFFQGILKTFFSETLLAGGWPKTK